MKQFILIFFASIFLLINTGNIHAQLNHNDSINTVIDKSINDALLDKYESMLDEMVLILKEAMTGNAEAQQKYAKWQEESEPFLRDLASHFAEFTPEQMKRLNDKAEKISAEINAFSSSGADTANLNDKFSSEGKEYTASECSKVIDEYEAIVEQCIKLYPKVAAGEEQAAKEMQSLAEKIQAISEVMSACSSGYSKDDTDRIQQIADKFMKVVSSGN